MNGRDISDNTFIREEMLFGSEAMNRLRSAKVAVFGVGGVGGFCVEALARSGIGTLELVDGDNVAESNLNRQIIALRSTIGKSKTEAAAERIADINPGCRVGAYNIFWLPGEPLGFDLSECDYIADCVDTVTAKLGLIHAASEAGVPVISCMGMGNKLDPTRIKVGDIFKTSVDPLAKAIRTKLRGSGIKKLKVVWSDEEPRKPLDGYSDETSSRRQTPGSTAFVPSAAGLIMAGEIVKDLISL